MTYRAGQPKAGKCHAHKTDGSGPCKNYAIRGGRVCPAHGGRAPQVQQSARARLDAMVMPALGRLRTLIDQAESDSVKLGAIREVLDRTGYKLPERIEADNAVTIKVEYEQAPSPGQVIEGQYSQALQNGATNGKATQPHAG